MDILTQTAEAAAEQWLQPAFDEETIKETKRLLVVGGTELKDAFGAKLEFGTGGLRGIMGVGTNRMNLYTVGMATQGLANYINHHYGQSSKSVAIAYDSRNNSKLFARRTAEILASNDIKVFLFSELRPTPLLSFAVRYFKCKAGIVITASHNPKEYNGYKVYWEDGGQILPPHDKNIIWEVNKITSPEQIKLNYKDDFLVDAGKEVEEAYFGNALNVCFDKEKTKKIGIVYTSLHGTGITLLPELFKRAHFENVHLLESQQKPDGNFPTVNSPNPEEKAALHLGLEYATEVNATLLLGTDPDSDRVGVAVRDNHGGLALLNGNETAVLLLDYLICRHKEKGTLLPNHFIGKTIVTTYMLNELAIKNNIKVYDVLTGFKYIAELIKNLEGKEVFLGGGEESYGYLISDFVRDKDAILSALVIAEMTEFHHQKGLSLWQRLKELRVEYGFFKESLVSVTKKGLDGIAEINALMEKFRTNPPEEIAGTIVHTLADFKTQKVVDVKGTILRHTYLPKSNVLQFSLKDGTLITVRPSGTEPKIKYYFSVVDKEVSHINYESVSQTLDQKLLTYENFMKSY